MKISPKRRAKALCCGASSAWSPIRLRSGQAEEDDAMLIQRLADLGHRALVEILRDVDAGDLGAAGAREQAYLEARVAHDRSSVPGGRGASISSSDCETRTATIIQPESASSDG